MHAASATRPAPVGGRDPQMIQAAFRNLHGSRLHGFALLVTLGDRSLAARLAAEALAAGAPRAAELAHPERAAAWLRKRVVDGARRERPSRGVSSDARRIALEELGVDATAFAALDTLGVRDRAAMVAATVERLDERDVATIVGVEGGRLKRLLRRARRRAIAVPTPPDQEPTQDGPIAARVREITTRTLG
jgi:DNA-directed RNA polymerase specialized sigma24 family protein